MRSPRAEGPGVEDLSGPRHHACDRRRRGIEDIEPQPDEPFALVGVQQTQLDNASQHNGDSRDFRDVHGMRILVRGGARQAAVHGMVVAHSLKRMAPSPVIDTPFLGTLASKF